MTVLGVCAIVVMVIASISFSIAIVGMTCQMIKDCWKKNPLYWDTEAKLFDSVTIKMVESIDTAYQLYTTGELDHVNLSESNLTTIYNNESDPLHDQLVEKRPTKQSVCRTL
mgnify:CR=1 FL=1